MPKGMGPILAIMVAISTFALGIVVEKATESDKTTSVEYRGKRIDMVLSAANGAAHCGGYLIIDTDDGEALVGGCDR